MKNDLKKLLEINKNIIFSAYYDQDKTLRDLAKFYGCSVGSIRNLFLKHGKMLRPVGRKSTKIAEDAINIFEVGEN